MVCILPTGEVSNANVACGIIRRLHSPFRPRMVTHLHDLFDLRAHQVHAEATIVADDPLEVVTPAAQWSYAVWTISAHDAPTGDPSARIAVTARIRVVAGRIGIGWTLAGSDVFLSEHYVAEGGDDAIVVRYRRMRCQGV